MDRRTLAYLRVSGGPGQDLESQKLALANWMAREGVIPDETIPDVISGRKKQRPAFLKILNAVRAGWVAKLVVYRYDRIGRTARESLELAEACQERGTDIISVADGNRLLGPGGKFIFGVLALLAEREVDDISVRTKAGMQVAKAAGKVIGGGPGGLSKRVYALLPEIRLMHAQGYSAHKISKKLSLNYKTVRPIVRHIDGPWETRAMRLARVPIEKRGKRVIEAAQEAQRAMAASQTPPESPAPSRPPGGAGKRPRILPRGPLSGG